MGRLRIGIVGLNFGRGLTENDILSGPGERYLEVAAACDQDREKADAVAAQWGVRACHDLDDLLRDADIPVIGLFTGPIGRSGLVRRCIRAGKDVMTTKPFDLDPDAALDVLQEARRLGRVVHLNSPSPLPSDELRQIQAWRETHDLGRPIASRWETFARYHEQADGRWYDDPTLCPVAPIFRLGIYGINEAIRLLGEPEAVNVQHSRIFTGRPTPDNAHLAIRFRDGTLASVFASLCIGNGAAYPNSLALHFEKGSVYRNLGPDAALEQQATTLRLVRPDGDTCVVDDATFPKGCCDGNYQWELFHRAVRGETLAGEIAPEQIAAGIRVIAAMVRAEASGRTELT